MAIMLPTTKARHRHHRRHDSRSEFPTAAVIGAGHGGLALAGYLAAQGVQVSLWNRSPAPLAAVEAQGGIRLRMPGQEQELMVEPRRISCQMQDVVRGAEAILVALPATAHRDVARRMAPYLRDGQGILLLPGRTGGALEFVQELADAGCTAQVLVGEAQTFPFASRTLGPGLAAILGVKRELRAAALPALRTPELIHLFRPLLPMLTPAPSVLHTSLENMGAMLHPVISLLNAGRIESPQDFLFYAEGVTQSVARTLAAVDAERMAVAAAFDVRVRSLQEWLASAYGDTAVDLQTAVSRNPAYATLTAPRTLDHRYLWEDVPTGLVPLTALGLAAGVATEVMGGLARLAGGLHGQNYLALGRTLESMGLNGMCPDEIVSYVMEGSVVGCVSA